MSNAKVYSGLMSDGLFRRIISPSVYHGKIIFSREIRLSNVTLLLIHNCVCKRKNWDGAESKTRPSNLPDINLNQAELTRDTYLIFC
jgi:hypothetical protein